MVADTPENLRLKQQSELQSQVRLLTVCSHSAGCCMLAIAFHQTILKEDFSEEVNILKREHGLMLKNQSCFTFPILPEEEKYRNEIKYKLSTLQEITLMMQHMKDSILKLAQESRA